MQFELSIEIEAPADAAWAALADVEAWPRWTASMQEVRWLAGERLAVGARARVKQPGTPVLVWTVTQLEAGRVFVWRAESPGVATVGGHRMEELGPDRSRLTLSLSQTGLLAPLIERLTGARTRRFVQMELEGMKRAAEMQAGAQDPPHLGEVARRAGGGPLGSRG